jgi:alkylation response protein AidB-like acyl-CoA dehydrogenase
MYDLSLSPEQIEFRDTVREFVEREVKPVALDPKRLEPFEKPLLKELLDEASAMGLRTLMLPEEAGGAGADCLTACIVVEELAAGDPDLAAVLAHTAIAADLLFGRLMSPEQRARYLPEFARDETYHLAFSARDPAVGIGWCYHRPLVAEPMPAAERRGSEWIVNGSIEFVPNATLAKLFAVQVRTGADGAVSTLLVPRGAPGFAVGEPAKCVGERIRWHHGAGAPLRFENCRVPADHLVGEEGRGALAAAQAARFVPVTAAANLGVGRAAFEAAVAYAKLRRQGGRNIVEHQAIGLKLADCAIKLELARDIVWKAAWALDHPGAAASGLELPLHTIARVFTAEAVNEVALLSAECFGAMGVMRDMPLQKYVHDATVFLHSEDADEATRLAVAEAVAGYRRSQASA